MFTVITTVINICRVQKINMRSKWSQTIKEINCMADNEMVTCNEAFVTQINFNRADSKNI